MTFLEKAKQNRRIALNIKKAREHHARTRPQDIRGELVVIRGDVRPTDFDPDQGVRLVA